MFKKEIRAVLALAAGLLAAGAMARASGEGKATNDLTFSKQAFERLKNLAGDWKFAKPAEAPIKGDVVLRYRVVGGGSAVVETVFPDSDMEMVSVYHRDGDGLVMTHYCCCGNQPHLRAKTGTDKDDLAFELNGGCNLDPAKDMHMHSFRVRFVDNDHVHTECELFAKGKLAEKHVFELVRKK